VLDDVDEFLN